MAWFNTIFTGFFTLLVFPFKGLDPIWAMGVLSFLTGILMLWIFGKVSDQDAIKRIKDKIWGNLIGVRLFQHDVGVLLRLQGRILIDTFIYMKYSVTPMLIMLVPILLIMIQLNLRFSVGPLKPGETALVKVKVRDPSVLKSVFTLQTPKGLTVETPGVRMPTQSEVAWRLRADQPGRYSVTVRSGETAVDKSVVVGDRWGEISALRTGKNFFDELLWPGEAPIGGSSIIESIEIQYPELPLTIFGFQIHWLVLFFILSIAFGFAFKGVFGVQI